MKSGERIESIMNEAQVWDRLAGGYDRTVRLFSKSYPRVRELLRRDLEGHGHVLEVSAGTGQFTFALAETVTRLTATDVSAEMIRHLESKLTTQAVDNVVTAVMSGYELDVADGSFFHLCRIPELDAAFNAHSVCSRSGLGLRAHLHGVFLTGISLFDLVYCGRSPVLILPL